MNTLLEYLIQKQPSYKKSVQLPLWKRCEIRDGGQKIGVMVG